MSRKMKLNRGGREIVSDFKKAGIEIDVVCKKRHHLLMFRGDHVFTLSHGTQDSRRRQSAKSVINKILRGENAAIRGDS